MRYSENFQGLFSCQTQVKVSEIPNESKKADFVTKLFTARQIGKTRLLPQAHELAMG